MQREWLDRWNYLTTIKVSWKNEEETDNILVQICQNWCFLFWISLDSFWILMQLGEWMSRFALYLTLTFCASDKCSCHYHISNRSKYIWVTSWLMHGPIVLNRPKMFGKKINMNWKPHSLSSRSTKEQGLEQLCMKEIHTSCHNFCSKLVWLCF